MNNSIHKLYPEAYQLENKGLDRTNDNTHSIYRQSDSTFYTNDKIGRESHVEVNMSPKSEGLYQYPHIENYHVDNGSRYSQSIRESQYAPRNSEFF